MNERFQELAERAGIKLTPFTVDGEEYDFDEVEVEDSNMLQSFAELIVNECCKIFVELKTRPADLAVKDVKKHFGVER